MTEVIRSNSQLQVLKESELLGRQFKVYGSIAEPLFLAKDVAEMIQHSDTGRMVNLVDDDEKLTRTLFVSGQNRQMWFLTEGGLYEVLFQSRLPIAKDFKKGVKAILKSIRRTGGYSVSQHGEYVVIPEHVKKQWLARAEESAYQRFRLEGCKEMVVAIHGVQPVVFEGGLWYNYAEAVRALGGKKADSSKRKRKYPQHFKLIYGRNFITAAFFNLLEKYYRYKQSELDFGKTVAEPAEATVMGIPASSMEEKKEKGGAL